MPGSPAPEPRSIRAPLAGTRWAIEPQLSRCGSQIRSATAGPTTPRSTPQPNSNSAYLRAVSEAAPNISSTGSGQDWSFTSGTDSAMPDGPRSLIENWPRRNGNRLREQHGPFSAGDYSKAAITLRGEQPRGG